MGIVSTAINYKKDMDMARLNRSWQLDDMARQEAREDTSYQRTMSDLRKAGLSASALSGTDGSGAVATPTAISTPVGDLTTELQGIGNMVMSGIQSKKEREQNESQFGRGLALSYEQLAHSVSDDAEKNRLQGVANQISEEANKIAKQQADEQERKDKEAEYDGYVDQINNVIETGTYNGSKLSSSASVMGNGIGGEAFKGTPWKNYGYDTADSQNIANMRRDYGSLGVMWKGDIPVFVTTKKDDKGRIWYYDPSDGKKKQHYNGDGLGEKPPKAMKINPDGTVTNSSGDYSNPMTN